MFLREKFLPLAMRVTVPEEVCSVLIDLCSFLKHLCNVVLKVDELNQLQNRVVLILCHMEMLFPPAFFIVMVHLMMHLVKDAKIGGSIQYRWMYPIERYLGKLKSYVRNKIGNFISKWRREYTINKVILKLSLSILFLFKVSSILLIHALY